MMTNLRIHRETEMMDRNKMERERKEKKQIKHCCLLLLLSIFFYG